MKRLNSWFLLYLRPNDQLGEINPMTTTIFLNVTIQCKNSSSLLWFLAQLNCETFFSNHTLENDVCLVFPEEPLDINGQSVASIQLGDYESCRIGSQCFVSGWGNTQVQKLSLTNHDLSR